MTDQREMTLKVNGAEHRVQVETRMSLADALREKLSLTGTHLGCEHGMCGACTVWADGKAVRACLMLAATAEDMEITTIEGLSAEGEDGHVLQRTFSEKHGLQCGFCTPGMIMTSAELLRDNPQPTADEVRECLGGNICRCTGYEGIVEAVLAAAEEQSAALDDLASDALDSVSAAGA